MCSTKPANLRTLIQNPHGKRKVYIPAGNPLTYTHTVLYGMCVHIHTIQQRNKYTQESFLLGIAEQGIRAGILQTIFLVSNHTAGAVLGSTVTTTISYCCVRCLASDAPHCPRQPFGSPQPCIGWSGRTRH